MRIPQLRKKITQISPIRKTLPDSCTKNIWAPVLAYANTLAEAKAIVTKYNELNIENKTIRAKVLNEKNMVLDWLKTDNAKSIWPN